MAVGWKDLDKMLCDHVPPQNRQPLKVAAELARSGNTEAASIIRDLHDARSKYRDILIRLVDGSNAMKFGSDGFNVSESLMAEIRKELNA